MADYSEFPTTPTAWQEIDQFEVEDPPPPPARRAPDLVALVPGVFFTVVAVAVLVGADLPLRLIRDGGFLWILLIAGGALLLIGELRKARHRRE